MRATLKPLILLCIPALLLASGTGLVAQQTGLATPEPLTTLLAQDWEMVAPSVLQRVEPGGQLVTLVIGSEGYAWALRQAEARLEVLERRAETVDTDELRRAIREQRDQVARLTLKTEQAREESWGLNGRSLEGLEPILQQTAGCGTSLYASAEADFISTGPRATASASFYDGCNDCGETYAYAYADGKLNGTTNGCYQVDPSDGCGSASSYATCNVPADEDCYSYAYAWAEIPGVGDITRSDTNYVCRPVVASINGPTSVTVFAGTCRLVTWYASATGGTGSYTFNWRYNGASVGVGTSYTRGYCATTYTQTFYDTVSVTASDTDGNSDTASQSVRVTLEGDCYYLNPESGQGPDLGLQALPDPCIYPY